MRHRDTPSVEPSGGSASEPIDPAGTTLPESVGPASAPGAPEAQLHPGARLGRYEIMGRLGAGGMGVVLEARDTELDRTVALKVVRPSGDAAAAQARLRREAQAMARLSHPNVAAVFDIGTVGERLFIAMELVRGGTLRDLVGRRRPWRDELRTLIGAGRGLAAAHEAGVIHRDFKPDNVLVRDDGTVRVADFGIARESAGPHDAELAAAATAQTVGVAGTPGYMAPEIFEGITGAAADQFAFAVTAFELLEGHRPFEGGASIDPQGSQGDRGSHDRIDAYLRDLREGRRKPWRRREVPARIRAAIDRGLALDPAARWPSVSALCDALAPRRSRALVVALALVLAAGAATAATAAIAARTASAPDPAVAAPGFGEATRQQLTFSGDATLPRLSPDGRWLAYALGAVPRSAAVQDLTTGRTRIVYRDEMIHDLRWSHDGAQLLLVTDAGNLVLDRDGAPRARILGGSISSWSPDDTRVVTTFLPIETGLTSVELRSNERKRVALALDTTWVLGHDWSRHDRLAVLTLGSARYQIWTMRPDGTEIRAAATDTTSSAIRLLGWSAGSEAIYYERVRGEMAELVRVEIDPGSEPGARSAILLATPASDREFSISEDGRAVAYARTQRSTNLVRWSAGEDPRPLTVDTRDKGSLVLSRDRRRIAYVAGAGTRKQIFIAAGDGANATPLGDVAADFVELAWAPDGARIACSVAGAAAIELWTIDVATGQIRKLAHSPTSPTVVWTSPGELVHGTPENRGYRVLDLATGRERELASPAPDGWLKYPEPSPDGRRIAVAVDGPAANTNGVWSISLADGAARRLYLESLVPIGWSEDGAWVYVQSKDPSKVDLAAASMTYAVAASGTGEIRQLLAPRRPASDKIRILPGERMALALEDAWRSDVWRLSIGGSPSPVAIPAPEPAPASTAHPHLTNGDLSAGDAGRAPEGWSPSPYGGAAALTDQCHGASDRCAIVTRAGWLEQRVAADAYRGRRIRLRARTHATGRSKLGLWLETPTDKTYLDTAVSTDAAGWQVLELLADVRPDARQLIIKLEVTETSSALFDDVSLEILER